MTTRTNMTRRLPSKALLLAFVAFLTSPAVSVAQDHIMEVSVEGGKVKYKTRKGKNSNGYIFINGDEVVQWVCKDKDACDSMTINLGASGLVCTNNGQPGAPGPLAANPVTCNVDSGTINSTCQKSPVGTQCSLYTTTVYHAGDKSVTDDPEFIVDDSGLKFKTRLGLGALVFFGAVGGGIFLGRRWGKAAQTS
jgi:hypothetical protein